MTSNLKEKPMMDISEEFHREASPDNLEEEVPEDPIDPVDSDMEILDKMERDYNQDAVYQNVDNVNAEEILESNKVQDSEGVHG